jgi:putative endonuclease
MQGWMYILECSDNSYYTGSTNNLRLRLEQHLAGEGANHTKKRLPVKVVYYEEFQRIDEAFYREKQVQGWGRKKKEALIKSFHEKLPELSIAYRDRKVENGGGFESLNHHFEYATMPEALEGGESGGGFESLNHHFE